MSGETRVPYFAPYGPAFEAKHRPVSRLQRLEKAVAELLELHECSVTRFGYCVECNHNWPCPTVAILERLEERQ